MIALMALCAGMHKRGHSRCAGTYTPSQTLPRMKTESTHTRTNTRTFSLCRSFFLSQWLPLFSIPPSILHPSLPHPSFPPLTHALAHTWRNSMSVDIAPSSMCGKNVAT